MKIDIYLSLMDSIYLYMCISSFIVLCGLLVYIGLLMNNGTFLGDIQESKGEAHYDECPVHISNLWFVPFLHWMIKCHYFSTLHDDKPHSAFYF